MSDEKKEPLEESQLEDSSEPPDFIPKTISDQKYIAAALAFLVKDKISSKKIAVFTHKSPDPDAIASMMGIQWLFRKKYDCDADLYYQGRISHPQNNAMDNLLEPGLKNIEDGWAGDGAYDLHILVDTIPNNAGVGENEIVFDLVVDHHPDLPDLLPNGNFNGVTINLKAGSCAGTIFRLVEKSELTFDDDIDYDKKVATALIVGIMTDTENMLSPDTTEHETDAFKALCDCRDANVLKQIVFFKRPKFWIIAKAQAAEEAHYDEEGYCIVGMGNLPTKHWDLLADQADEMVQWDTVHTAIAFAVIGEDTLVGCVRSTNASVTVKELCKKLGGKYGTGGGKQGKGRYTYALGGLAFLPEEDEETKEETWQLIAKKERNRILRVLKK
jgi:nanoRNase/pAp phosphatase (c-di-AMP/oligoRNAs hydrolase)